MKNQPTQLKIFSKDGKSSHIINFSEKFYFKIEKGIEKRCTFDELQKKANDIAFDLYSGNYLKAMLC